MKPLKLGLFSYSYHLSFGKHDVFCPQHPIDIFEFMDRAKAMGFDGIQIDITHLESHDDAYLERVRQYATDYGFYIEYGSTGIEADHTLAQLEIAHKLNADIMRTFMGFNRYDPTINAAEEVDKAVNVLQEVEPIAKTYGIKIAVENHCDATVDEILQLMQRLDSSQIGMCVDLGNFMIHLENPTESVERLAPYIINTHFKDYAVHMENYGFKTFGVPLGEGVIDLPAILKILVEKSGLDRIMLEIPVEQVATEAETLAKEDSYVRQSAVYARDVLGIR